MDNRPIGVFDSGIGGLSVLKEIKKILPNEKYIFVADQKHVPYGGKTSAQLIDLADKITSYFVSQNAKMVVIACNTSTCYSINAMRSKYPNLPFVGTVPAVKKAVEKSVSKSVAVISTPATAKSPYLKKLIEQYAKNAKIVRVGCAGLENAVEEGDISSKKVDALLNRYLKEALKNHPDYIVLGCTHYPFLKKAIQRHVGSKIKLIDSGKAIARRVDSLLSEAGNLGNSSGGTTYLTTGDPERFASVASVLLKEKISAKKLEI